MHFQHWLFWLDQFSELIKIVFNFFLWRNKTNNLYLFNLKKYICKIIILKIKIIIKIIIVKSQITL